MSSNQDWKPVVFTKTNRTSKSNGNKKPSSQFKGRLPDSVAKQNKLDRTEIQKIKKVGKEVGNAIAKARIEKEMNQKQLANIISESPSLVMDYEKGVAIPNQNVLNKMEKALGVILRGKMIGQVKTFKKKGK